MKVPLCKVADIPETGTAAVDLFGREVLVFRQADRPKAVLNYCNLGGPMKLEGDKLVCQWHGALFSCADGACLQGPARPETRLIVLPTRVEGSELFYVYGE
ncbi:MAG: Rieske (2Fe-2S) protein [Burkholderiales bacterium]